MLSLTAFAMVATFMTLIMTRRLSALVALVLVPIVFALLAGFGEGLGPMMLAGVKELAPTGVMLLFAILYFGLMIDVGLFTPVVNAIIKVVGDDPVRILVGTAILALTVSLDGDGTTTYMITVTALLPIYLRLGLDRRMMACVIIMSAAVTNLLPWGGPLARAATALQLDPSAVFMPLIPAMFGTAVFVVLVAYQFGLRERRRLRDRGPEPDGAPGTEAVDTVVLAQMGGHGGAPLWFNAGLTIALMVALIAGVLPLPVLFIVAFAIALMVNFPRLADQRARIVAHAGNALAVVSLVFAAGIFTGILSGTGMVDAMAGSVVAVVPPEIGAFMAPIVALISIPFTFLISNDAFYFGMLPVLATAGAEYQVPLQAAASASMIGQQLHLLSPLVPSTYLLAGLARIDFAELQRFSLFWALCSCLVMLGFALLTGAFPLRAG